MKHLFIVISLVLAANHSGAQIISNGGFLLGTLGWGCNAEVNVESLYGGSSSNAVAEIDAAAGLCQTFAGLTIGNAYVLSFSASRRTGGCPSPPVTNVNITVSGGVLATTVTRTNTTFGLTNSEYLFVANSIIHTVTFAPGSGFGGSTCGLIVDNVSVTFSPLPIKLLYFEGAFKNNTLQFDWATGTESNNHYFEIERSKDAVSFERIITTPSKAVMGNSESKLAYESDYSESPEGLYYYRLKQVDYNNTYSYSKIISIASEKEKTVSFIFPNPNHGGFQIKTNMKGQVHVSVINYIGKTVHTNTHDVTDTSESITINSNHEMTPGIYYCILSNGSSIEKIPFAID